MKYVKLFVPILLLFCAASLLAQPINYVEVADIMPRFPGCEDDELREGEKADCSNLKLVKYLGDNIKYPELAMEMKTEGVVIVDFIIDEKGNIVYPEIVRDVGEGCGEEALRVIKTMPQWTSGKHKSKPVAVKMRLPVRFNIPSTADDRLSPENFRIFWGDLRKAEAPVSEFIKIANSTPITIRDLYGKPFLIDQLTLTYERGAKIKVLKSKGTLSAKMAKMVSKVKEGSKITVEALVQKNTQFIAVKRSFKIVK